MDTLCFFIDKDRKIKLKDTLLGNKSTLFSVNYNFVHFCKMEFLGDSLRLFNVKTHKVTRYFKGLDKRRRTLKTRAFYLKPAQNGSSSKV